MWVYLTFKLYLIYFIFIYMQFMLFFSVVPEPPPQGIVPPTVGCALLY